MFATVFTECTCVPLCLSLSVWPCDGRQACLSGCRLPRPGARRSSGNTHLRYFALTSLGIDAPKATQEPLIASLQVFQISRGNKLIYWILLHHRCPRFTRPHPPFPVQSGGAPPSRIHVTPACVEVWRCHTCSNAGPFDCRRGRCTSRSPEFLRLHSRFPHTDNGAGVRGGGMKVKEPAWITEG